MKLFYALVVGIVLAGSVQAENLLPNPEDGALFGIWSKQIAEKQIPAELLKKEGYKGSDSLKVDLSQYGKVAVDGLILTAGKKYRFGAYVRTKDLKFKSGRFLIHNKYWRKQISGRNIPSNTYGMWREISSEGILPESVDGQYTFALSVLEMQPGGELEISAPFIEEIIENVEEQNKVVEEKLVAPGCNILPDFSADYNGEIGLWSRNLDGTRRVLRGKGVDGSTAISNASGFRLDNIALIPGETYRFGAYVKTNKLDSQGSRIVIFNYKWANDVSTEALPADTNGEWKKIEAVKVIPKSRNSRYTFNFYIPGSGDAEICMPFIVGVSEKARNETPAMESYLIRMSRIFPVTPLLTQINAENPQITFSYSYPIEKPEEHVLRMRIAETEGDFSDWKSFSIPSDRQIKTEWGTSVAPGKGRIEVEIRRLKDNVKILSSSYKVMFVDPLPEFEEVRLNNLVTELKNVPLVNGKIQFVNPRDGWVYIGFSDAVKNGRAVIDGTVDAIVYRNGEISETMRYLSRGTHELTVSGIDSKSGRLVIRTVPEIILFPLEVFPERNKNLFNYDWSFYKKYFLHSANVFFLIYSWVPERIVGDFEFLSRDLAERGIRIMGSDGFYPDQWMDLKKMKDSLADNFPTATTAGRAIDETDGRAEAQLLNNYAEACWEFTDFEKYVYLWLAMTTHYLDYPLIHAPLISGASHIGHGRGKLLMETYVETTPDLPSLEEYYQLVKNHMVMAKKSTPDAPERMIMVMSGLLMNGAWNCNAYPQSDIKYALDYFFHLLATEPEAKGLYGVGCYNLRYADEENARWISLLLRHYAIDGKKEMLSPEYGIVYNPGHVVNGDFVDGLTGWTVEEAEPGSIRPHNHRGYGHNIQRRRGPGINNGDNVVEIVRSAVKPNKLIQTFKNFEVGELYSLSFVTSDGADIENGIRKRSYSYLDATLEGAEIIEELSYEFRNPVKDDWGTKLPNDKLTRMEMVTRKIVFRAMQPEIKVEFSDWKNTADPGGEIGARRWLNFVNVNRYFAE